ncbi:hypothetical protein J2W52_005759 [Rhizobium miluonense]|jgi:hypothetical protein|uniref:Uncharacterized protein n=1 Tax=Rhizobium miluonense TaxID=411945 RepID=A0ABU1SYX6_9HYPH|nr:hypothetical protein [Rhizobium miluonense]
MCRLAAGESPVNEDFRLINEARFGRDVDVSWFMPAQQCKSLIVAEIDRAPFSIRVGADPIIFDQAELAYES